MQPGFFGPKDRHGQLGNLGDPLPKLPALVGWDGFRPLLNRIRGKGRKSTAGRKPYDVVLMFEIRLLQSFYGLGDDQAEYQIRGRYPFCRFLGPTPEGKVPGGTKAIWLFREALKEEGLVGQLFAGLENQTWAAGYRSRKGQVIGASLIAAPRQRNSREGNAKTKKGEMPEDWEGDPAKLRQKGVEARWTKGNGENRTTPASTIDTSLFVILRWPRLLSTAA